MKKMFLSAAIAASLLAGAGAGVAQADKPKDPGREYGMCTAFFNGQKKGHDKNGYPGPFQDLVEAADDGDSETSPTADVYDYCQQFGIGGNPDENGRFTECWTDDPNSDAHPCDDGS